MSTYSSFSYIRFIVTRTYIIQYNGFSDEYELMEPQLAHVKGKNQTPIICTEIDYNYLYH